MSVNNCTIEILDMVDSTNNYAMGLTRSGLWRHGNACIAMEQSEGKGTRGKKWESEKGVNVMMSIMVETSFMRVQDQFYLSAVTALACLDIFSKYSSELTKIKWPNDIYYGDRKAGGILIENVIMGPIWQNSIIGIGLNINQESFTNFSARAVSLKQITGRQFDIVEIATEIYNAFIDRFELLKSFAFDDIIQEYNLHLFRKGEKIKLKTASEILETIIMGVSKDGYLYTTDVIDRKFSFGEIEWVL